ncbi:GNAT family N-acetyltransferase [[Clostridium] innocuum]|nr:GNAT family N-acetyltransferase [[Clostridium] innocuum]MCR0578703.1 GNAT family N-acetyltransferase [[Clostridium] innocuum]
MEICELDIAAYRGKALKVRYTTSYVYEAVVNQNAACFGVMFQRTALPKPLSCGFDDIWGSEWLTKPELYGECVDGQIVGLLEICMEDWSQRLRISNLFVEPADRGRGCATRLLEHAIQVARQRDIRCVLLETQSCNDPAIQCYLRSGFVFLGCDLSVASNQDIQRKNVRIEMGYYL